MGNAEKLEPVLPHDDVLEQTVLGAIIAGHKQAAELLDIVREDDFFNHDHRKIHHIMLALKDKGVPPDLVSIYDEMQHLGELEGKNLFTCLANLGSDVHKASDVIYAARRMREFSISSQFIRLMDNLKILAQARAGKPEQLIQGAIDKLSEMNVSLVDFDDEGISHFDAAKQALLELDEQCVTKIYTGLDKLDQHTGGFRPGELVIITAETGSGKTLLAQQTRSRACRDNFHSLFCTGEMTPAHLKRRELAPEAGVDPFKMRRDDELTSEDRRALLEAAGHQCKKCRILGGELEISRIRKVASRMKAKSGLDLLVMDYDELIDAPGRDEIEQLRNLVRSAKTIGMQLECAVILISQLRKEYGNATKPDTRPPSLQRLYGSGAKVKHASMVIYADRKWEDNFTGVEKEAHLWILKNRDGRTGRIKAIFNIKNLRFEEARETAGYGRSRPDGGGL